MRNRSAGATARGPCSARGIAAASLAVAALAPAVARAEPFTWRDVYFQDVDAWGRRWERSTCFALSKQPLDRSGDGVIGDGDFEVLVDDLEVPATTEGGRAWRYEPGRIALCFQPGHVPARGVDLAIEYAISSFDPAAPADDAGGAAPSATGAR